jgi:hypothetical protein
MFAACNKLLSIYSGDTQEAMMDEDEGIMEEGLLEFANISDADLSESPAKMPSNEKGQSSEDNPSKSERMSSSLVNLDHMQEECSDKSTTKRIDSTGIQELNGDSQTESNVERDALVEENDTFHNNNQSSLAPPERLKELSVIQVGTSTFT